MARDGIFFRLPTAFIRNIARRPIPDFSECPRKLDGAHGHVRRTYESVYLAGWIFYGFAVVALFRMRKTKPDLPRRTLLGYPGSPVCSSPEPSRLP